MNCWTNLVPVRSTVFLAVLMLSACDGGQPVSVADESVADESVAAVTAVAAQQCGG